MWRHLLADRSGTIISIRRIATKPRYVFFDLETTSLSKTRGRITELAIWEPATGVEYSTLVNPGCEIPRSVQRVNGISSEMVSQPGIPSFPHIAPVLKEILGDGGKDSPLLLIGHNVRKFDAPFLEAEFGRCNMSMPHWQFSDTLEVIRAVFDRPAGALRRPARFSLDYLREWLGIETTQTHRALDDCKLLVEVVRRLAKEHGLRPEDMHRAGFFMGGSNHTVMAASRSQFNSSPGPDGLASDSVVSSEDSQSRHKLISEVPPLDRLTPLLVEYVEEKARLPKGLLLFRVGDFYEAYFEDARRMARALDMVLTGKEVKGLRDDGRIPMTGFPASSLFKHVASLVAAGHVVSVVDQVGDVAEAKRKGVRVTRALSRVFTPGTVVEEEMLRSNENNFVAAVHWGPGSSWALAHADVSTGEFAVTEGSQAKTLYDELLRLRPSEVLVPTRAASPYLNTFVLPGERCPDLPDGLPGLLRYVLVPAASFRLGQAGSGRADLKSSVAAALTRYIENTLGINTVADHVSATAESLPSQASVLRPLRTYDLDRYMELDETARVNLELERTSRGGKYRGSVLWAVDDTVTPMGGRLLRHWLRRPLLDVVAISDRHDAVSELSTSHYLRQELRALLRSVTDIERLAGRVRSGKASPRCVRTLGDSLLRLPEIASVLKECNVQSRMLRSLVNMPPQLQHSATKIVATLVVDAPVNSKGGGFIADKADTRVDGLRNDVLSGVSFGVSDKRDRTLPRFLVEMEARERGRLGVPALKVVETKTFGYCISIPLKASRTITLPPEYDRRQTLSNEQRYTTPELMQAESVILRASEELIELEHAIFADLKQHLMAILPLCADVATEVSTLDVLCSFAQKAVEENYVRPAMLSAAVSRELSIVHGRHPVVEALLASESGPGERIEFVPNSTVMCAGEAGSEGSVHESGREEDDALIKDAGRALGTAASDLVVLTGPNAGGKSVYLKQIGVIQVLAQMGSFVPAEAARLSVCDKIFTRVGGADDLAAGKSTFMVEMSETANILNNAGPDSLVLLDEVGRGTATFDGLAIAWATSEYLATVIKCKTIFATHYHEINSLAESLPNASCLQVSVTEGPGGKISFTYSIKAGGADRSYGIQVAALAGFPSPVLKKAYSVLDAIQRNSTISVGMVANGSSATTASDGSLVSSGSS